MPGRLMAGRMFLEHLILVRVQARQHFDKLNMAKKLKSPLWGVLSLGQNNGVSAGWKSRRCCCLKSVLNLFAKDPKSYPQSWFDRVFG